MAVPTTVPPRIHRQSIATTPIALPIKDEGAYLVVCRGDDLHASGLVLVTPLAIEVQEDGPSGRVRTTIKDRVADKYVTDVHVKTIGSRTYLWSAVTGWTLWD